nr:AP-5 complex subunit zeta-1 [Tanacetum cinerariifolium]
MQSDIRGMQLQGIHDAILRGDRNGCAGNMPSAWEPSILRDLHLLKQQSESKMDWEIHLRTLSSSARDSNFSNDPSSDASLLHSVRKLIELCKNEDSDNLIARVYPQLNKIFQRSVSQSKAASSGLLLL